MTKVKNVSGPNLKEIADIKTLTERAAAQWGNRVGLVFDEFNQELTFNEINLKSNAIANVLIKLGVNKGDRVGIMLKNRPEFPLTWLAIGKIGAIMVPINIYYKEFDAKYLLEHSEAKVIVTTSDNLPLLNTIKASVNTIKQIISVDDSNESELPTLTTLCEEVSTTSPSVPLYPEDTINIQYTSGTTGRPKGCILTHNYWLEIARLLVLQDHPGLSDQDVMLTAQPFYYMDPQWNVIASLASGAPLIVLDRFHPSSFWEKVRQYKVTFFYCLGIMPVLMLKMPESKDDRDNYVKNIFCSAIPVHLHKELEERWGAPWYELFGSTETGADILVTKEDHDSLVGSGSIGKPCYHRDVRIVDNNDQVVPRGKTGELVVRGTGMMEGYYKNPEATKEVFRNGYYHTGDIARMDDNGLIYYVGRIKEMIRRSGENISATEVEDVIKLHPVVNYVATLPVPDSLRGEEVKAYIVLKDGINRDDVIEQLIDFCTERLAYFKIPRYWEFKTDLPKTPSEKIAKHKLRDDKDDLRLDSYDRIEAIWR